MGTECTSYVYIFLSRGVPEKDIEYWKFKLSYRNHNINNI